MSRSVKKGPFVDRKLLKVIEEMNVANEKKVVKTWSRRVRKLGDNYLKNAKGGDHI